MTAVSFRTIKPEIRVLGIHDGDRIPKRGNRVHVMGVVMRGGRWLDGVLRMWVTLNGDDATENIVKVVGSSPHMGQLRVILLPGFSLGGANIIDIAAVWRKLRKPVIVYLRDIKRLEKLGSLLRKAQVEGALLSLSEHYKASLTKARIHRSTAYVAAEGIVLDDAVRILHVCTTLGNTPEPLRVARLLAAEVNRRVQGLELH